MNGPRCDADGCNKQARWFCVKDGCDAKACDDDVVDMYGECLFVRRGGPDKDGAWIAPPAEEVRSD